jgi:hypothetical protein
LVNPAEVFDDEDYLKAFDRVRIIPRQLRDWYSWDLMRRVVPEPTVKMLDAGAGLGQFTESIHSAAHTLNLNTEITLLDSSLNVCNRLRRMPWPTSLSPTIANLKLEDAGHSLGPFDAILLSEVVHLFDDLAAVVKGLRGLAGPATIVAIRLGTREQVQARDWYRWYPEAHQIDIERSPSGADLVAAFHDGGFRTVASAVDESRWLPAPVFQDMMAHRAFSGFRMATGSDHAELSRAMLRDTSSNANVWFSYEMTWLIAQPDS